MSDLLFEIGTEEVPAGYLRPALDQLRGHVLRLLEENRLPAETASATGTPRRLALSVCGIPEAQPVVREEVTGPPARVAFNEDGTPGKAAEGFARSQGVPVESLTVKETDKGSYVTAVVEQEGRPAADVLPGILAQAAQQIVFPKSMRWPSAERTGVRFARPVRWIVALLGDAVLDLEFAGVRAGRVTRGHAFLADGELALADASFDAYRAALADRSVLVDMDERRETIRAQVETVLAAHGSTLTHEALLEEVTNLVESPHAVEGAFDDAFLETPDCVIVAAMMEHQRYFPVRDGESRLLPRFVTVSNRGPEQESTVRAGNERVLRARLADARFFWNEDRTKTLDDRVARLSEVAYLGGLGHNLQRTERLEELAGRIAELCGMDAHFVESARSAARLCKADLVSELVGEFPGLQGVIGGELAREHGEPEAVATAVAEHYRPAGAGDALPSTPPAAALALADKLDVIVGCFALGLLPTGSQDPYALRRSALGTLMILEAGGYDVELSALIGAAADVLEAQADQLVVETKRSRRNRDRKPDEEPETPELVVPRKAVLEFFRDRLYHAAVDRWASHDMVRAVLGDEFVRTNVADFRRRLAALQQCAGKPFWPALVELVDRTYRIQRDLDIVPDLREDLCEQEEERALLAAIRAGQAEVGAMLAAGDYVVAAECYVETFAEAVHAFFDEVFVNVDDAAVRENRKAMCAEVYRLFADGFADLYVIETAG